MAWNGRSATRNGCSKYIFCDRALLPLVVSVLQAPAPCAPAITKYREQYIMDRAGDVRSIADMDLPNYVTLSQEVWELSELLDNDTLEY